MILSMTKARVLGPRERLDAVVGVIQDARLLHLVDPRPVGPLRPGSVLPAILRVLAHFGHDLVSSHVGSGAPEDWLLLLPALVAIVLARPRAFLASRAWYYLAVATVWLAADAVAIVLAPWPLEYLLAATVEPRLRGGGHVDFAPKAVDLHRGDAAGRRLAEGPERCLGL